MLKKDNVRKLYKASIPVCKVKVLLFVLVFSILISSNKLRQLSPFLGTFRVGSFLDFDRFVERRAYQGALSLNFFLANRSHRLVAEIVSSVEC